MFIEKFQYFFSHKINPVRKFTIFFNSLHQIFLCLNPGLLDLKLYQTGNDQHTKPRSMDWKTLS